MLARKCCSKCKQFKKREYFGVDNRRKDGKYPQCKACVKAYRDLPEVKAKRREYHREYTLFFGS